MTVCAEHIIIIKHETDDAVLFLNLLLERDFGNKECAKTEKQAVQHFRRSLQTESSQLYMMYSLSY